MTNIIFLFKKKKTEQMHMFIINMGSYYPKIISVLLDDKIETIRSCKNKIQICFAFREVMKFSTKFFKIILKLNKLEINKTL